MCFRKNENATESISLPFSFQLIIIIPVVAQTCLNKPLPDKLSSSLDLLLGPETWRTFSRKVGPLKCCACYPMFLLIDCYATRNLLFQHQAYGDVFRNSFVHMNWLKPGTHDKDWVSSGVIKVFV